MPEILLCLVKGCHNSIFKDLHLCRHHFYQLPKDIRSAAFAMRRVLQLGEISEERFLLFIRRACQLIEPDMVIIDPKQIWQQISRCLGITESNTAPLPKRPDN